MAEGDQREPVVTPKDAADFKRRVAEREKKRREEAQRREDAKKLAEAKKSGKGSPRPNNPGLKNDPKISKSTREKRAKAREKEEQRAQTELKLEKKELGSESPAAPDLANLGLRKNVNDIVRQNEYEGDPDGSPSVPYASSEAITEALTGTSTEGLPDEDAKLVESVRKEGVHAAIGSLSDDPTMRTLYAEDEFDGSGSDIDEPIREADKQKAEREAKKALEQWVKLTEKKTEELMKLMTKAAALQDAYTRSAQKMLTEISGNAYKGAASLGMQLTGKQLTAVKTQKAALTKTTKTADKNEKEKPYNREQYSFTGNLNRLADVWSVGTNASQEPPDPDDDRFWRDMSDCIPCMQWTWGETDVLLDDLLAILKADLDARISIFLDLKALFDGNPVLDELCQIMKMFKNLCPQDLLSLIAMLVVRTIQLLESMRTDLGGMLKDIIGTFLRPLIHGLSGFLNLYGTFLWDQVDCILNIIQTSTNVLSQTHTAMPWADDKKNWLDSTSEAMQETDDWMRKKAIPGVASIPDVFTEYTIGTVNKSMTFLGQKIDLLLDTILEYCHIDFIRSDKEMGFQANLMAVATMIDIGKIFYDWYKQGNDYFELCSEEGVNQFIDEVNDAIPNVNLVNADDPSSDPTSGTRIPRSGDPIPGDPGNTPGGPGMGGAQSASTSGKTKIEFSIKSCLNIGNSNEADLLSRWAQELQ